MSFRSPAAFFFKAPAAKTGWDGEAAVGGNVPGTEAVKGKANFDGTVEAEEYMVRRIG